MLAALLLLVLAAPSPAPVAPRKCGNISVGDRTRLVKADQVRCRNGDSQTQLKFRCWKHERTYFAIKR